MLLADRGISSGTVYEVSNTNQVMATQSQHPTGYIQPQQQQQQQQQQVLVLAAPQNSNLYSQPPQVRYFHTFFIQA